jgi:MFS transporter, MHS family, shikimate and dehydroshikimate transport protein
MRAAVHAVPQSSVLKVAAASLIGTTIEWYDFFLYGTAAALIFNQLFFPSFSPVAGTLAAYATFSVGFLARPLGGVLFGHYGDRLGRKSMLVLSLVLMGVATVLIGLLPTYQQIGLWASVLLVVLRFAQGIAVGGEWGGAVLMATEHAPPGLRGFFGSWPQMGVPAGLMLSTWVFHAVSERLGPEEFLRYGWRLPFLLSIALVGVGLFIRMSVVESPAFAQMKSERREVSLPVVELFRSHRRAVGVAMGAFLLTNGSFYILMTFVLSYGTAQLGLPRGAMLQALLISAAVQLFALPAFALLSDRIGRRPVYLGGALFIAAFAFPLFWMLDTREPWVIALALVLGQVGVAAMYGPQAAFFTELFGTHVRYSGASVGYQLATIFAGGLSPLVSTGLVAWAGGASWPISIYILAMAVVTVTSVSLAKETFRTAL